MLTGGIGTGKQYSESHIGRAFAQRLGVLSEAIIIEENSHTTQQNLREAATLMRRYGMQSAIIVSEPLHLKRANVDGSRPLH